MSVPIGVHSCGFCVMEVGVGPRLAGGWGGTLSFYSPGFLTAPLPAQFRSLLLPSGIAMLLSILTLTRLIHSTHLVFGSISALPSEPSCIFVSLRQSLQSLSRKMIILGNVGFMRVKRTKSHIFPSYVGWLVQYISGVLSPETGEIMFSPLFPAVTTSQLFVSVNVEKCTF